MTELHDFAEFDRYIDRHIGTIVDFVTKLVAFRTDSQTEGSTEFVAQARGCQSLLAEELRSIGLDVRCEEVAGIYPAVVGKLSGNGAGRTLALNGHFDVVPSGDRASWATDPWSVRQVDGRLYGRGVADMKSGIAAQVFALRGLVECGAEPVGDVWLHLVSDEEVVGQSTRQIIQTMPKLDGVVDSEPTGLKVMPVEGGLVHLRIEIDGQESHAGNRYTVLYPGPEGRGVNAIEKAVKVLVALQSLERDWAKKPPDPLLPPGFNSLMPGLFFGGPGGGQDGRLRIISNAGTTPNYASMEYNIWYLPSESFEDIRQEIETYLMHVYATDPWLREHPPRLTWKVHGIFYPPCRTSSDHPIVRELRRAIGMLGLEGEVRAFGAASELAWYAQVGVGGSLFGPGSVEQAHAPNESIELSEIVLAAKCLGRVIWNFSSGKAAQYD